MDLCKVVSLLCNTLSRFVIAFLPRSKHLLISWLQSLSSEILEPKKIQSITVSIVSHLFAMKWWDWMPWTQFFECWGTDFFKLWCWRRLLRVPWTVRRSNQSILREINPEYSLEGLMLKLKLQNFLATWCEEQTQWERPWCWERLKVGGEGDDRRWDGWMESPTQWTWVWVSSRSWWWTGTSGMLQSMGSQRVGHDWVTELNWRVRKGDSVEYD